MMRRVVSWITAVGVLTGGVVLGTQVSMDAPVEAAVNGGWSALGGGLNGRVRVTYQASTTLPTSSSNPLYVGGTFTNVGGDDDADYLAKWDGAAWSKVAATPLTARTGILTNYVDSIAKVGDNLYVGGVFKAGPSIDSINIAKIDLTNGAVSGLSSGMAGGTDNSAVEEIVVIGSNVYAGGAFGEAKNGATAVSGSAGIAVWNGTTWGALAGGLDGPLSVTNGLVNGLATDGITLYVGGQFDGANAVSGGASAVTSRSVMSWDGTAWAAMSTGQRGFTRSSSPLTAVMLARSTSEVYAAGRFTSTNDTTVGDQITLNGIAKWNGTAWSALGTGVSPATAVVETLATIGSGASATLWVGGEFTSAGGVAANNIAKWDGTSWDSITCGTNNGVSGGAVRGIAPQSDGSVIVAGAFTNAGGNAYIAKFTPGADNCSPLSSGPTAPRNVIAQWTPGFDGVRISWDPPESDGGVQINGYRAVTFDDRVRCWTTGLSCVIAVAEVPDDAVTTRNIVTNTDSAKRDYLSELVFTGGTPLGFYVQAGTALGWGLQGWSAKADPGGPPLAPTTITATAGWKSVTVSWSPSPARGGYATSNYLVQATPSGQVCITRLTDASFTSCTFTKLRSGTDYTFTVQGLNAAGWGNRSQMSNAASPFELRLNDVSAKKKLLIFREVTVTGTAVGYVAGTRVQLFWRRVGADAWSTDKKMTARVKGKKAQQVSFTRQFPRNTAGQQFEFRLAVGDNASETKTVRIP